MLSRILFALITAAMLTHQTSAAPVELLFSQTTYVPGEDVVFDVRLPELTGLSAYNIDVILSGSLPTAGTEFSVDVADITPANAGYIFDNADLFLGAVNVESATQIRLTGSDFSDAGTDVVNSINDAVATIRVTTLPSYFGDLIFSVDADNLFLDDINGFAVTEFASVASRTAAVAPIRINAVPEPSCLVALSLFGIVATNRRRRAT